MRFLSVPTITAVAGIAALGLGGCAPVRTHQGYVIDADLVNSVQPGVATRQSVLDTLGTPTFTSQFGKGQWFYLARDSRNYAYHKPKAVNQIALRISFDDKGTVTRIDRTGIDQVVKIDPAGRTTPTLGHKRTLFEQLFGNIGTVGAAGTGGATQGRQGP
jgi:outer membrane protein assembly factor BamE (lipoprotein component of BamABCDE complex)